MFLLSVGKDDVAGNNNLTLLQHRQSTQGQPHMTKHIGTDDLGTSCVGKSG